MSGDNWNEPNAGQPQAASNANKESATSSKEWKLIEKLLTESNREHTRSRRWGILFKGLTFVYLFAILFLVRGVDLTTEMDASGNHTALINVAGVIADGELAGADAVVTGLRRAFENEGTQGVILRINSPGGSPVQSGYIYDEVKRLRAKYPDIKLYAVISDIGASGGYYIASAADEIYADKASLVGSIGVIAGGFGFVEVMEKIGIERRLYTSGDNKAFLDPFSPRKEDEEQFWSSVLDVTHQQFIKQVKEGRGERLKAEDAEVFNGLVWTGEQALELGLVDALGSSSYVARDIIGEEKIVDFTPRMSPFEEFTKQLGVSVGSTLAQYLGLNQAGLNTPQLR